MVVPRQEIAYFWDCPHCQAENEISFGQSDHEVACQECGKLTYVESTTAATEPRKLDQ